MKIVICSSSSFRDEKIKLKQKLIVMGHEAIIHPDYEAFARGEKQDIWNMIQNGEHAEAKKQNEYIRWYYKAIVGADAILVLNLKKGEKENYIGGNVLMEIGFAHVHNKKIFLYNPVPKYSSYKDEIKAMYTEIINGDLTKIK